MPEFGRTLGEELLTPTRVYAADLLALIRSGVEVHALTHVTGGGLAANLARVLPPGLVARVDRSTWTPPPVFTSIAALGRVPREDLERTLNMGVGFCAVLPEEDADEAVGMLRERGIDTWPVGVVAVEGDGTIDPDEETVRGAKGVAGGAVQLVGEHA